MSGVSRKLKAAKRVLPDGTTYIHANLHGDAELRASLDPVRNVVRTQLDEIAAVLKERERDMTMKQYLDVLATVDNLPRPRTRDEVFDIRTQARFQLAHLDYPTNFATMDDALETVAMLAEMLLQFWPASPTEQRVEYITRDEAQELRFMSRDPVDVVEFVPDQDAIERATELNSNPHEQRLDCSRSHRDCDVCGLGVEEMERYIHLGLTGHEHCVTTAPQRCEAYRYSSAGRAIQYGVSWSDDGRCMEEIEEGEHGCSAHKDFL